MFLFFHPSVTLRKTHIVNYYMHTNVNGLEAEVKLHNIIPYALFLFLGIKCSRQILH